MATLMRSMVKLNCNINRLSRILVKTRIAQPTCSIFTSNKKKDSAAIPVSDKQVKEVERLDNLLEKDENWISHGYDFFDRDNDEWEHHVIMFSFITLPTAWLLLFVLYYPDPQDRAWEKREALLEIARREKLGLPLIDANLIDTSKIHLPSDEELGDFDVIV